MPLTLDDLHSSPDHYLHSFEGDTAVFVPMDRSSYRRSIFLDARIAPKEDGAMRLPVAALTGGTRAPAPTGWIFHVAHCGSTLLARALGELADTLVLREPLALRQVALAGDDERLRLVAAMVSKRYAADRPTIVKANVPVNFILPRLLDLDPAARAIFLHMPLEPYLLAILRSDNHRVWLRRVTEQLAHHLGDLTGATDAERAATLWFAQMTAFADAIERLPDARSLDAQRFLADPARFLAAAATHLQVAHDEATLAGLIAGPLFATYSKNPDQPFDNRTRLARQHALAASLVVEIAAARRMMEAKKTIVSAALDVLHAARLAA